MRRGHVTPIGFRKAALASLYGFQIPMTGQVPIDTAQPNVSMTADGNGMIIDRTPVQEMWDRWSVGNFDIEEHEFSAKWRANIAAVNLPTIEAGWKEFAEVYLEEARSLKDVSVIVQREIVDNFSHPQQQRFLWLVLQLLEVKPHEVKPTIQLFEAGLIPRLKDYAPYASFLGRICLVFLGGLGRGLVGRRPTNFIDLQYAFYSPFCMLFASSDKFHRELWPLAEQSRFIWGPDLKNDLAKRVQRKKSGSTDPELFDSTNSIIELVRTTQMRS
jgi:hypothetical protein